MANLIYSATSPMATLETIALSPSLLASDGTLIVSPTLSPIAHVSPMSHMSTLSSLSMISPISPITNVNVISSPDSIVPPTVMKVNTISSLSPIGLPYVGETKIILPTDIFIPSLQLVSDYKSLHVPIALYEDVCNVENIKSQMTKIIYYKFLDKWLYDIDEAKSLLGYFKVSGDRVDLIKNLDQKDDVHSNSQAVIDKKVDYIEKNIVSQNDIYAILKKFVDETHISWCRLIKAKDLVRDSIVRSVKNKIKKMIGK